MISSIVLLLSLLILFVAVILLLVTGVKRLLKKEIGKERIAYRILFVVGLVAFFAGLNLGWDNVLLLLCAFFFLAAAVILLDCIVRAIIKKPKKLLWICIPILIAASVGCYKGTGYIQQKEREERIAQREIEDIEAPEKVAIDFEIKDGDEPLEVIAVLGKDPNTTYQLFETIYDQEYLGDVLSTDYASVDQCIEKLNASDKIDENFKGYFTTFLKAIDEKYPGTNMAILYDNLDTLGVEVLSAWDYPLKAISTNSLGVYRTDENMIYIPEGTDYTQKTFGYQVLVHEFCHAMRIRTSKKDGMDYYARFTSSTEMSLLGECMNSVYSCSLLPYYEWDIAYQMPSNYLRIMIECMDNYDLSEYMSRGDTYFLSKLDEYNGDVNYAYTMWKLINLQRADSVGEGLQIEREESRYIYDYLAKMYFGKYITVETTDEEALQVLEDLKYKTFYDAPEYFEGYDEMYDEYFETYMNELRGEQ